MQVLVVEDEPLIRMSICDLLEEAGFACVEASNAREALALLGAGLRPAILMTDYNLGPGMNGRALALEALARLPGLAVVHVTANADYLLEHGLQAAEQVIAKPFNAATLVGTALRLQEAAWFGGLMGPAPLELAPVVTAGAVLAP
ncbi:response regulator [Dankookia sp. P2]|uniref:response regulator n=1 Tax=Dankookia sp. P2 TaxID=3423955 RepID=UPI003D665043